MKVTYAIALVVVGLMSVEANFRRPQNSDANVHADVKVGLDPFNKLIGSLGGAAGNVVSAVGGATGKVVGSVGGAAGNVVGSVGSAAGSIVGSAGGAVKNVVGSVAGAVKTVVEGTLDFLNPEKNVKKDGCIFKSPEILSKLFQPGKTCTFRGKNDDGEEVQQYSCQKQSGSISYCKGSESKSGKISESCSQVDIVDNKKVTATISESCKHCVFTEEKHNVASNVAQFVNNTIQKVTETVTFDCNKPFVGHQERIEMEKKYPCMSVCKGKQVVVGTRCENNRAPSTGCKKMQTLCGGSKNQFIVPE